jgi:hypothetical protein
VSVRESVAEQCGALQTKEIAILAVGNLMPMYHLLKRSLSLGEVFDGMAHPSGVLSLNGPCPRFVSSPRLSFLPAHAFFYRGLGTGDCDRNRGLINLSAVSVCSRLVGPKTWMYSVQSLRYSLSGYGANSIIWGSFEFFLGQVNMKVEVRRSYQNALNFSPSLSTIPCAIRSFIFYVHVSVACVPKVHVAVITVARKCVVRPGQTEALRVCVCVCVCVYCFRPSTGFQSCLFVNESRMIPGRYDTCF